MVLSAHQRFAKDGDLNVKASPCVGNDRGETLIEVLAAIIIIGTAIAALVGGLATTILTSSHNRERATANTLLRSYAEGVKQFSRAGYFDCTTTYVVPDTAYILPPGWTRPTNIVSPCPGGVDAGTQRVTITVESPTHARQILEIWVRRV